MIKLVSVEWEVGSFENILRSGIGGTYGRSIFSSLRFLSTY